MNWDKVMNDYFTDNERLKVVLLLLDCRHEPNNLDLEMLDYLAEKEIPAIIVLTKIDKLSRSEVNNQITKISKLVRYNRERIIPTSATKKQGTEEIGKLLDEFIV